MDYLYYLFVILAFIAVVLFLEGTYLVWNAYKGPEAKQIERRLRTMSAEAHEGENLSIVKKRLLAETPALDRLLLEIPRIHHLDKLLVQSGVALNVAGFLWLMLMGALAGVVLATVFDLPLFAIIGAGIALGILPLLYLLNAKRKRLIAFELQLPDALDLMGRALRAGHAFPGALKMVGEEMPEPVAGEFRTTFEELNYGINLKDALQNLAMRAPSEDLRYFVIAVLIQRETGGNLTELLDSISAMIRARLKLLGTIRVYSAEGRLSAWILGILPFVLAIYMNMVNPKLMSMLWTDPVGLKLVWIMLLLMVIGAYWMRRIIKIHV
ncbi:MAG: type II secretion system F family protein [Nitrosomonadales bacterium]|nr:type II secretion system F family protein [Nitrosomonadales bacterium]